MPYLPVFDTGEFQAQPDPSDAHTAAPEPDAAGGARREPAIVPAQPAAAPTPHAYLKRWKFASVVVAVWTVGSAIGLGLYYWWVEDMTPQKVWPVFVVLVYLVACVVGSLLLAMVQGKPIISALSVALMSAPLASTAAAAALYGAYVFHWIER